MCCVCCYEINASETKKQVLISGRQIRRITSMSLVAASANCVCEELSVNNKVELVRVDGEAVKNKELLREADILKIVVKSDRTLASSQ